MPIVLLIRHGETSANAQGILAGRLAGVHLNERGIEQARAAGQRISELPIAALVSSPLERTRQTAKLLRNELESTPRIATDVRLTECDYGDWSGLSLKKLAKQPLWTDIQRKPSLVTFPGGEAMATMAHRAVSAVRTINERVANEQGPDAIWVAVSHGDVIKAIIADALGMHLDNFQRLHVEPASISVVNFTKQGTFVLSTNSRSGDLSHLHRRSKQTSQLGGGK